MTELLFFKLTELNEKQIRFCDEYLVDFNASQAAFRAGYSKKTGAVYAFQLLQRADVQKYLESRKIKLARKLEITQERTLREIARLAYSDIRKLFNDDGSMKVLTELDDDTAAALSAVEVEERRVGENDDLMLVIKTKKLKLRDKLNALEMLAKHFKIYEDITPVTVNNNVFDLSKLSAVDLKTLLDLQKKMSNAG